MPVIQPAGAEAHDPEVLAALTAELDGRYTIERSLGGGMSTVWLATNLATEERVAIKVLRSDLSQFLGLQRFLREIRIASDVHAPELVPLLETGECAGVPYYVMPFIDGESLRDRIRREQQLSVTETMRIAGEIAKGLDVLHASGIIHRDIKPDNVLLAADGRVLVGDYGIARAVSAIPQDELTTTGIVVGTPMYMSPEQAGGGPIDLRSDIYSLGCLTYEMLAGTPPFQGATTQAVIARHMADRPPPLKSVRPDLPAGLDAIVNRSLAKTAADRFASARAFAEALNAVDVNDIVSPRMSTRRRTLVVAGLTALAAVAAYGAFTLTGAPGPLDAKEIVILPLATPGRTDSIEGQHLALLIGSAFERTGSMKWVDGWALLEDRERRAEGSIGARRARAVTRGAGARYFVNGAVTHDGDSITAALEVHDVETSEITRARVAARDTVQAADVVIRAVIELLPKLAGLSRVVDLSGLSGRNPAALGPWLAGERAYRQSNMRLALEELSVSVRSDSLLAVAALRAALAASWVYRPDSASQFVRLALRHETSLSEQQRLFARAFERYLAGRANEAVEALRPLLSTHAEWAEAWMLLGEIQLHLTPTVGRDSLLLRATPRPRQWPLESNAESAFLEARRLDPQFAPPLTHLAEIALRRGDAATARRYTQQLAAANADTLVIRRLSVMGDCVEQGPGSVAWARVAQQGTEPLYLAGHHLEAGTTARARECAHAAFRAVLDHSSAAPAEDWGAVLGLNALLVGRGDHAGAVRLLDSSVSAGTPAAHGLYVIDAALGINIGDRAQRFLKSFPPVSDKSFSETLWLMMVGATQAKDTAVLKQIATLLQNRISAGTARRLDSLVARSAAGHLALARRDTNAALMLFGTLQPTAPGRQMENDVWESLAFERLAYARLLLATGDAAGAHRVASLFDAPLASLYGLLNAASLEVRIAAARSLGDTALLRVDESRLRTLRGERQ